MFLSLSVNALLFAPIPQRESRRLTCLLIPPLIPTIVLRRFPLGPPTLPADALFYNLRSLVCHRKYTQAAAP